MRLKGISEEGIRRLARVVGQQEPDYGEGNDEGVKAALEKADAKWTSEGWIIDRGIYLESYELTRLPKIKSVNGNFSCAVNQLTSLEGCPQEVNGHFWCEHNPGNFTEEDVRAVCDVAGNVIVGNKGSGINNNENNNENNIDSILSSGKKHIFLDLGPVGEIFDISPSLKDQIEEAFNQDFDYMVNGGSNEIVLFNTFKELLKEYGQTDEFPWDDIVYHGNSKKLINSLSKFGY